MKNRNWIASVTAIVCLLALLCMSLAGCGIADGETDPTQSPTDTQAPTDTPTTEPTQPPEPTIYNTKLLPRSASYAYTRQEILDALQMWLEAGYTQEEALGLARNEIYADQGYAFADADYTRYFYTDRAELYGEAGTLSAQQAQQLMNEYQQQNIATLQAMEAQLEQENALVVDLEDPSIASSRYRLPFVRGDAYEAVNQKIREELMPMADEVGWDDIGYSVGYKDDAVSILVKCEGFSDDRAYYTYHFSRSTGALLEQKDILSLYGLSKQEFDTLAEAQALDYYETSSAQWAQQLPEEYAQLRQETVSHTLDNTRVFVDINGNLGFVAYIGMPAGSGHDDLVLSCWKDVPVVDVSFSR